MRAKTSFLVFLASLCLVVSGFSCAELGKMKEAKAREVEASGSAIWIYLQKADYRSTWKMWPGKGKLYEGTQPHGAFLTTYINSIAYDAVNAKKGELPAGSIIVKENYAPDKKFVAMSVMYKVEGYNPEANNWFWVKYQLDGKIDAEGKVERCIGCHTTRKDNDYIWTGHLK